MKKYILYGVSAEFLKNLVPLCLEKIKKEGGEVLYYCDSDKNKWDEKLGIYSPEKILENPEAIVVVLCHAIKQVEKSLREKGVKNEILYYPHFGFYFYADKYYKNYEMGEKTKKWIEKNEENIRALYNLEDEYTKDVLAASVAERKLGKLIFLNVRDLKEGHMSTTLYFHDAKIAPKNEFTLVDVGACTGDSIELIYKNYGEKLKKAYAFEPEEVNFMAMEENLKNIGIGEKCKCFCEGLWSEDTILYFSNNTDSNGTGNISSVGNIEVKVQALDNISLDIVGELAIKMDIEGAELEALKGAKNTITKYTPYLAICIYHKMKDILEIPAYINSINPNYKFYLRAGRHLECYAVPKKHFETEGEI